MEIEEKIAPSFSKGINCKIQNTDFSCTELKIFHVLDIESNRQFFTNGNYSRMAQNNLISTNVGLDLVDSVAILTVLFPDLKTKLRVDSILNLSLEESVEIVKEFKTKVEPWYSHWIGEFKKAMNG